jgi:heme-degrading monooxygenase HmoA
MIGHGSRGFDRLIDIHSRSITVKTVMKERAMVTVIWDTRVKTGFEKSGRDLVQRIWADMKGFSGYVSHRLLQDKDDAGHFIIVSEWTDRESADRTLKVYADAEPVQLLMPLLATSRQRFVLDEAA